MKRVWDGIRVMDGYKGKKGGRNRIKSATADANELKAFFFFLFFSFFSFFFSLVLIVIIFVRQARPDRLAGPGTS